MTTRTRQRTVTFRRPFVLAGVERPLPAGDYKVETDEELIESLSFVAYRRVLTVIHIHPTQNRPRVSRTLTIDPNDLDAALERDRAPSTALVETETGQRAPDGVREPRLNAADSKDIDRAEDEGMLRRPV